MPVVDSEALSLDPGESETLFLEWETDETDGGAYTATASSDDDSDTETVTVGALPDPETEFAIPMDTDWVLVEPESVEIDYESITISAHVEELDRDRLEPLRRGGDETNESTAFGAFRRTRRDDGSIRSLVPPRTWRPPLETRDVVPLSYSEDQVGPGLYQVEIGLGLVQPRGREAAEIEGELEEVARKSVTLDQGESTTTTIKWDTTAEDSGVYSAQVSTTSEHGVESSDTTTLSVATSGFGIHFPTDTIGLEPRYIHPVSRENNNGVESVTLELHLGPERAATVLANGSRVDASTIRSVPDGPNRAVDTLPESDLTAEIRAPIDSEIETGQYILMDWSMTREHPIDRPFHTELQLAVVDKDPDSDLDNTLFIGHGEVYIIDSGETETYEHASVYGELVADGTLELVDEVSSD